MNALFDLAKAIAKPVVLWTWFNLDLVAIGLMTVVGAALAFFLYYGIRAHRSPYVPDGGPNTDDDPTVEREALR